MLVEKYEIKIFLGDSLVWVISLRLIQLDMQRLLLCMNMEDIVVYYPKNSIYIQSDDEYREIFTILIHDKKLYLINAYCYKERTYPGIQLALKLKDKDSIICSALLSALQEVNDGEREYKISKEVCNKVINMIDLKSCINQINICKYSDYHEHLSRSEKIMLKLITKEMRKVIFIYHRQFVLS